ncbi:TPA: hypothetical protein N0F65_000646 [Lagenidium giganteum]|uniref:Uncharacterized protein n=1 Tax=Lagenidium giganteum TaxID=4803 RepID=A0AAV2YS16_9STRA|nr:TPA: hypothetical protein N0F65_000646 [Lagenidium giganteum]
MLACSKTNQRDPPVSRLVHQSGDPALCPVVGAFLLLKTHGSLAPNSPAAVYETSLVHSSSVTATHMTIIIRLEAGDIGQEPSEFSSHSLRAGDATPMYKSGVDTLTIQFH